DDPDVRTVGKSQPREPEVDRHPALALLGQAVGIDARQRGDEGGFSVVDMAGSRDDPSWGALPPSPRGHGPAGGLRGPSPPNVAPRCTRSLPSLRVVARRPGRSSARA